MQPKQSISQGLAHAAKDMGEYQNLKESHDREVYATKSLFESLRRKLGSSDAALVELKRRGYNPNLIK